MTTIHVQRLTLQDQGRDPAEAQRLARRVVELLGEALVAQPTPLRGQPRAVVDVQAPPGLSGEQLAAYIAREIRARLG